MTLTLGWTHATVSATDSGTLAVELPMSQMPEEPEYDQVSDALLALEREAGPIYTAVVTGSVISLGIAADADVASVKRSVQTALGQAASEAARGEQELGQQAVGLEPRRAAADDRAAEVEAQFRGAAG
jgi:hypothetical protein